MTLELVCGPDDQRCTVHLTVEPDRHEFVDCSLKIQLPYQLDLRLSGFLFYSSDIERLRAAFDSQGTALDSPVMDSDCLLTIRAERLPEWVEWSFVWEGIFPVFQPFDPDGPANSKVLIRGLRALWSPSRSSGESEPTKAEQVVGGNLPFASQSIAQSPSNHAVPPL